MNSFNSIEKIKYTSGKKDELISLLEYTLFFDTVDIKKYLVFKFKNNIIQDLFNFSIQVIQYNDNKDEIGKSTIEFTDEKFNGLEEFVPKAKMKIFADCTSISISLIEAQFEKFKFVNGEIIDKIYVEKVNTEEKTKKELKKLKRLEKASLKANRKKSKKTKSSIKDVKSSYKTILPRIITGLLSIALIVFMAFEIITVTRNDNAWLSSNNFKYYVKNEEVSICGIINDQDYIIIPEKIDNYPVTNISSKAFDNTNIKVVEIQASNLTISTNAFINCSSLNRVSSNSNAKNITVLNSAFKDCTSLRSFVVEQATLYYGSLYGCNKIYQIQFNTVSGCSSFGGIFGVKNNNIPLTIVSISDRIELINRVFYEKLNHQIAIDHSGTGDFYCSFDGIPDEEK